MAEKESAYARAGVDIAAARKTKQRLKDMVRSTFTHGVVGDVGGFGGVFLPPWREYQNPVLVSSVDGVGTKLKLAFASGNYETIGMDIVFHCANDILVQGARPLFFMDYLAMGRHDPAVAAAVIHSIARGCREIGCALIGGETAEMPEFYHPGEFDLAGSIVGMAERDKLIDGASIAPGDRIIGLASDGLHTNGYSLARRVVFEQAGAGLEDLFEDTGRTMAAELLRPHRSYVKSVLRLMDALEVKGLVHITGGGFWDNIPRILPSGLNVSIQKGTWVVPPIFAYIQRHGGIEEREMFEVFNMGIGMMAFIDPQKAAAAVEILQQSGETPWIIGQVIEGDGEVRLESTTERS